MYRKMIIRDPKTGDWAMYLNGELVGYAATKEQAESTLNKLIYELLTPTTTRRDSAAPTEEATDA
jgi:hypothetical protein